MPALLKPSLKAIVADAIPAAYNHPAVLPALIARPQEARQSPPTLKERAKQLSVYLEPAVYDQLREIAHTERTKIHSLLLEGLDRVFRERGAPSIKEITK